MHRMTIANALACVTLALILAVTAWIPAEPMGVAGGAVYSKL